MAACEPVLKVENVSHRYGARVALDDITLTVMPGRVTMVLGPNGAGKTTLFSLIARLLPIRAGKITLSGRDLTLAGDDILAQIGIVFQQQTLDADLTVKQNLLYYAALHGFPRRLAEDRIASLLARFDMPTMSGHRVRTLNGGHRRRVELARALMTGPRLLLLDEPTVGLDIPTRRSFVKFLHDSVRDTNLAILWATHLADEAQAGDDVVMIARGKVRAAGSYSDVIAFNGGRGLEDSFVHLSSGEPAV